MTESSFQKTSCRLLGVIMPGRVQKCFKLLVAMNNDRETHKKSTKIFILKIDLEISVGCI